jgi:hypothetical protein
MHNYSFSNSNNPLVRAATLVMLAFCLCTATLLVYLSIADPFTETQDRYADTFLQDQLAHGMGWLNRSFADGPIATPALAPDCNGMQGAGLFDCRLIRLNHGLAQAIPSKHIEARLPDPDDLPDTLAAMRWLDRYSATPAKLSTLLQEGESAAKQSLPDPFRLNGCIGLSPTTAQGKAAAPCDRTVVSADAWPPHADHLLNSVFSYAAAKRGHSPNMEVLHTAPGLETPIVQGRHVTLTIDPIIQDSAQTTAACYTGDAAACRRCAWCNTANAAVMYEQARARSLGLLVLDAKSGAIEAAASAYTPCYEQQQRGAQHSPGCPLLPNVLAPHLDRLGNQAVEQSAKLGSMTKIPITLALQKTGLSSAEASALPDILTYSRTPDLIDIVMCKTKRFDPACARRRLGAVANMTVALGWRGDVDVLGAGQLPGLNAKRFTARLLSHSDGTLMTAHAVTLSQEAMQACSQQRWHHCQGADLVNMVAELFGTGEALGTPIGVGNALLHLAGHAEAPVPQAHLIRAAQDDAGQMHTVSPNLPPVLRADQSNLVLQGLSRTASQGTARAACLAAATALPGTLLPCMGQSNGSSNVNIRIAGKTGTPIFSADNDDKKTSMPLPQWRAHCSQVRQEFAQTLVRNAHWYALKNEVGKCNMVPTKWFAFLVGAPGSSSWDRVIVVIAERNWNQRTNLIDSPNDSGSNVAAEAGLALVNALYRPNAIAAKANQ